MQEPINQIEDLMRRALIERGIEESDAAFVVGDFLDAQLEGRLTHGIGKFLLIDATLRARQGKPEVARQHGATATIDGKREIGQLAARQATQLALALAETNGIG